MCEDRGLFCCFGVGCGAEGDVLDFVQKWFGVRFLEALPGAGELVAVHDDEKSRECLNCGRPTSITSKASKAKPAASCCAESRRSGKSFPQVGFNIGDDAAMRSPWLLIRFPVGISRPVYGLEPVPVWSDSNRTSILLVEGKKTRDCAAGLLPVEPTGIPVLSNMGGRNGSSQAGWSPVVDAIRSRGEFVEPVEAIVWPDADKPAVRPNGQVVDSQAAYAESLERSLSAAAAASGVKFTFRRVKPPSGIKLGWDLADAHAEGWSRQHVLAAIERGGVRLGLNEFLPPTHCFRGTDEPHSPDRLNVSAPSKGISSGCGADASSFIPESSPAPN